MRKKKIFVLASAIFCAAAFTLAGAKTTQAADATYETKGGKIYFTAGDNEMKNRQLLDQLLQMDKATIVLPKETFYIDTALRPTSNITIEADGATIISERGSFANDMSSSVSGDYDQLKNFTVKGGTWKTTNRDKTTVSMFSLAHASNITIENVTIQSHADGHAVELIACKNVKVKNSKMVCKGTPAKEHEVDEQIQVDLATPKCAPRLESKFQNGATCENIRIEGCEVKGPRGICVNLSKEDKYLAKYHKNIVIKNNKVTGMTSEAIVVFNTVGVTITGNTAISKANRTDTLGYNSGIHILLNAKPPASMKKSTTLISNNKAYGKYSGILVYSTDKSYKYGTVKIQKNRYYSKDEAHALLAPEELMNKLTISGNKYAKFKGI